MAFQETANKIIKDSILSSMYIDDNIVEPFEDITEENRRYHNVSKGLYTSFRKQNKSLDFYKFKNDAEWIENTDYIFKNRDLLILDWDLSNNNQIEQFETIKILKKAIETDNLHFISIYTETPIKSFNDIFYFLKASFDYNFSTTSLDQFEETIQIIEYEGIDSKFLKDLSGLFKEISLRNNPEALEQITEKIQLELGSKYGLFRKSLRNFDRNVLKACEILGFCLNNLKPSDNEKEYSINYNFIDDNFIVINHTIIQLSSKSDPEPIEHFNFFTNALLKMCGNLLTIASLEIRNLLRESSGFIGKDADTINEAVLFHHQSQKENFFSFIIDIWKSHTLSFVDYNSEKLNTLNIEFWNEYKQTHNIEEKINELTVEEVKFHNELGKLNVYYNSLHLIKQSNEIIKFGDVFLGIDEMGRSKGKYWLNITAHCDCHLPIENIKNNFYFIAGEKRELKESLSDGDAGFNSYLNVDNAIISIAWNQRPLILNIKKNDMVDFIITANDGMQTLIYLKYIGTLKENYTQRMANNSFSFAMRVGIDFATK